MRCPWCRTELRYVRQIAGQHFCSEDHRSLYLERIEKTGVERLAQAAARLGRMMRAPSEPGFVLPKSAVPVRVPAPLKTSKIPASASEFGFATSFPGRTIRPVRLRGLRSGARFVYRPRVHVPNGVKTLVAQAEPFPGCAKLPSEHCSQPAHLRHAILIGKVCEPLQILSRRMVLAEWVSFQGKVTAPRIAAPHFQTFLPAPGEVAIPQLHGRGLPVDQPDIQPVDLLSWPTHARSAVKFFPLQLGFASLDPRNRVRIQVPEGLSRDCEPLDLEKFPILPRVIEGTLRFPLAAAGPGSPTRVLPSVPAGVANSFEPEILSPAVLYPVASISGGRLRNAARFPEVPQAQGPTVRKFETAAEVGNAAPAVPEFLVGALAGFVPSGALLPSAIHAVASGRAAVTDQLLPLDCPEEWIGIPKRRVAELQYRPRSMELVAQPDVKLASTAYALQSIPSEWPAESTVHMLPLERKDAHAGIHLARMQNLSFRLKTRDWTSAPHGKVELVVQGALPLLPGSRLALPAFSDFKAPEPKVPFWNRIPMRAKGLLMAAPLAMVLVTQVVSSPSASYGTGQGSPVGRAWHSVVASLSSRAAVDVDEDFRAGLADWNGPDGVATGWRVEGGSLVPASFAVYRPSSALQDYHIQFSGQVRKKALGWAVRAADPENYYAIKLVTLSGRAENGPMQKVIIQRFPVIGGIRGEKIETPLHLPASAETVYHVAMNVSGDHCSLSIQGQVVDTWTLSAHEKGGVGFFSEKGEQATIQGLRINHQTDTVGRLCAWLIR